MTIATQLINAERQRQLDQLGYTIANDARYIDGELLHASFSYLVLADHLRTDEPLPDTPPDYWPWAAETWKPTDDPLEALLKAAALIAAEMDRILEKEHIEASSSRAKKTKVKKKK